jgi:sugar phosphate isomerase/epimerase
MNRNGLGISTSWWSKKDIRGQQIVEEVLELGFSGVELEYRITERLYQEMRPWLEKALNVFSIHNFFPKPADPRIEKGGGDLFLLSSVDAGERERAVSQTIRTIEHASDLSAQWVVLHLGRVDMPYHPVDFKRVFQEGRVRNAGRRAFLEEQGRIRLQARQKHLDAVLHSLEALNREADRYGVFLGIENRYHFNEIPSFEEIGIILEYFKGGRVRYWHDTGHARAQENMGVCQEQAYLRAYAPFMAGIHLHDIRGFEDHLAPGQGDIDFNHIAPFLKDQTVRIMEMGPRVSREAVRAGREMIEGI